MEARKSQRSRKVTQRASEFLQDEDIFGSPQLPPVDRDDDSLDEFDISKEDAAAVDEEISADERLVDDDAISIASDGNESEISDVIAEAEADETIKAPPQTQWRGTSAKKNQGRAKRWTNSMKPPTAETFHSRGVPVTTFGLKDRDKYTAWLTAGDMDQHQQLKSMISKFYDQPPFPTRRFAGKYAGGLCYSAFQSDESRARDAVEAWKWFDKGLGKWSFQRLQKYETLSEEALAQLRSNRLSADLVSGKPLEPRLLSLPPDDCIDADELFQGTQLTDKSPVAQPRRGWLVNLGAPTSCLAWAPNQAGLTQYLVVCPDPPRLNTKRRHNAFAPAEPSPSCIHILEFTGADIAGEDCATTISNTHPPRRILTLTSDWSRILQAKFCPIPRSTPELPPTDRAPLGLLALITADGHLRILNLTCPPASSAPETQKLTRFAFSARPQNTVCTCVTWLSSTLIAAGTANGYIAIWDLERHFSSPSPPASSVPEFYHHCHDTYIVDLTSCYPSMPHLLLSSSMDGYVRLTDIRDVSDSTVSIRSRSPLAGLNWLDNCQCFVGADDAFLLKGASVRLVDHYISILKCASSVTGVAVSAVHSGVLIGCADGSVVGTNAVRRLYRRKDDPFYKQVWVGCEWRRGRVVKPAAPVVSLNGGGDGALREQQSGGRETAQEQGPRPDFPNGLSRIVTGFRTENVSDKRGMKGKRADVSRKIGEERAATTIYERQTAILSLAWNPNLSAGGWAAVGLGSGLLLVEDLCYD